jgi:diaminopimelate decarboxylase
VHAGSDLRDVAGWAAAGVHAVRLLWELAETTDSADTVDFGGGFPADGLPDAPGPAQFRASLEAALRQAGLALPRRCAVEPGRAVVGAAGWLVSSVLHSRSRPGQPRQVVLDAGMTELIRPALYGSRHPVHAMRESGEEDGVPGPTVVEGPVCESTDTFGAHHLPPLARGDLVAIERAGAYAASFTSRYNGRPQPVEVMRAADGTLRRAARAELGRADGGIIPQFP